MNEKKYNWMLYTISAVIVCTICIQVYWNYKNYHSQKQQLINDVQISLDKAIDDYYANLAERTTVGLTFKGGSSDEIFKEGGDFMNILSQINETEREFKNLDCLKVPSYSGITVLRGKKADSLFSITEDHSSLIQHDSTIHNVQKFHYPTNLDDIELLTSKVVISINNDTLVLKEVDSLLQIELSRKKLNIDYILKFKSAQNNMKHLRQSQTSNFNKDTVIAQNYLSTISQSSFLPQNSELKIEFTNETKIVLIRILNGILISGLLVLAVISCLFYLLNIIKQQKQLAEVKNDLISNITHEFKTPIATIGVALESIKDFKVIDDKTKTKTYLDISTNQLSKLNVMVEKLLETATLDSDALDLNLETIDLNNLLADIITKHQIQTNKTITFNPAKASILAKVDPFHFDNAINNVIDNANKYGGDIINIAIRANNSKIKIIISDNGNTLNKTQGAKIFEKFYRVQKGNTHDVKGFGIGLYYTKRIVEKHNGTISIKLNSDSTTFIIEIPNG